MTTTRCELTAALLSVRAIRAQVDAAEALIAAALAREGEGASDLCEAELVPRYFKSARVLRETIKSGALMASRSGRTIIVRRTDLDAYLSSNKAPVREQQVACASEEDDGADILALAGCRLLPRQVAAISDGRRAA
jgi:hypothetical protein